MRTGSALSQRPANANRLESLWNRRLARCRPQPVGRRKLTAGAWLIREVGCPRPMGASPRGSGTGGRQPAARFAARRPRSPLPAPSAGREPASPSMKATAPRPVGRFGLVNVFYRADRLPRPVTRLPAAPVRHDLGWCDDPTDRRYNRPVRLPCPARHERSVARGRPLRRHRRPRLQPGAPAPRPGQRHLPPHRRPRFFADRRLHRRGAGDDAPAA